jgi:vanillate/4-hydroxybenzoate decarboxylase subunit D
VPHSFQRPTERHLSVTRTALDGTCPECGAAALASYRVLGEGGWFEACKCQACLASLSRVPAAPFGSYVPLGLTIARGHG